MVFSNFKKLFKQKNTLGATKRKSNHISKLLLTIFVNYIFNSSVTISLGKYRISWQNEKN